MAVGLQKQTCESRAGASKSRLHRWARKARSSSTMCAWIAVTIFWYAWESAPMKLSSTMWRKGAVAENKAGTLVRMAEGQAVTYKLTKTRGDMLPIEEFPNLLRVNLGM